MSFAVLFALGLASLVIGITNLLMLLRLRRAQRRFEAQALAGSSHLLGPFESTVAIPRQDPRTSGFDPRSPSVSSPPKARASAQKARSLLSSREPFETKPPRSAVGREPGSKLISVPNLAATGSARDAADAGDELGRRFGDIWSLADEGRPIEEIGRRSGLPTGQVELILGLRRRLGTISPEKNP